MDTDDVDDDGGDSGTENDDVVDDACLKGPTS